MPLFEFCCKNDKCVHYMLRKEELRSIRDQEPLKCVMCGTDMVKLMSRSEFRMESMKLLTK